METRPVPKDGGELRNKCYMLITDLATYAQENLQLLWVADIFKKLLKVSIDDVDDGVVLIDHNHIAPLIEGGAGVRDTERNQIT